MSVHQKHKALDQIVHWLLALTMWACAASILMEVVWKHSVLPSAARSLSCIMQGMWLIQVSCAHTIACGQDRPCALDTASPAHAHHPSCVYLMSHLLANTQEQNARATDVIFG